MSMYAVTWSIDIEASTPKEAAEAALRIHRDPYSIATVFHLVDQDGHMFVVDVQTDTGDPFPDWDDIADAVEQIKAES